MKTIWIFLFCFFPIVSHSSELYVRTTYATNYQYTITSNYVTCITNRNGEIKQKTNYVWGYLEFPVKNGGIEIIARNLETNTWYALEYAFFYVPRVNEMDWNVEAYFKTYSNSIVRYYSDIRKFPYSIYRLKKLDKMPRI